MENRLDKEIYKIGIWMLFPLLAVIIIVIFIPYDIIPNIPCMSVLFFHLYCPGCGGTRAVRALFQGHIIQSLFYHPIVVYTVAIYFLYMIKNTLFVKGIGKGMKFKTLYLWLSLALIICNVIVKNIMWKIFQLPMEQIAEYLFK